MSNYATSLNLQAMPAGTVSFHHADGKITARISAFGLTPGSSHLAQITSPMLGAPISFGQFTAGPTGQVSTTLSSDRPLRHLPSHAVFQIELTASPGETIAFVNVGPFATARPLGLIPVEAAAASPLAGHASLSYDGQTQTLTVRVDATGFMPNTTHAAHVHSGTCEAQGAPIIMLQDLRADANGRIAQTDVMQNVTNFNPANGLYLNIHEGNSANILDAAGNPTPQFRPLLCANLPATGMAVPGQRAQMPGQATGQGSQGEQGQMGSQMGNGGMQSSMGGGQHGGKGSMSAPMPVTGNGSGGGSNSSQGGMPAAGGTSPAGGSGSGQGGPPMSGSGSGQGGSPASGSGSGQGTSPAGGTASDPGTSPAPGSGSGSTTGDPAAGLPDQVTQLLAQADTLDQQVQTLSQTWGQTGQDPTTEQSQLATLQSQAQALGQQFQQEEAQFQADGQVYSVLSNAYSTSVNSIDEGLTALASKEPAAATSPASDAPATPAADPNATPAADPTATAASDTTTPPAADPAPAPAPVTDPAPVVDPAPPVDLGGGDLGGGDVGGGD